MKTIDLTKEKVITLADLAAAAQDDTTELLLSENAVVTPSALEVRGAAPHLGAPRRRQAAAAGQAPAAGGSGCDRGPLQLRRSPGRQGRNLRRRPQALDAPVRRRQRRQHLLPHRPQRGDLHSDPDQQVRPAPAGYLHGRSDRQATRRRPAAHQRNPHAPGDLQGGARGQGRGALPSAARHRVRHHRPRSAHLRHSRSTKSSSARSRSRRTKRRARRSSPDTVIPFVKTHNTVLLANHGIVCWGDTVTHAEWYAEVVDTYCWTLMLAAQLGSPISHITNEQRRRPAGHQEETGPSRPAP